MDRILALKLLGSPQVSLNGESIFQLISRKAQALLIYVAVTGKTHSREHLAEVLWQNMPLSQSMKNLRTVLPNVRRLVGKHLIISRQTIEFNRECPYSLDVEAIQAIQDHSKTANLDSLAEAVTHYQGDFLEGFHVPNAPEFENWALMERERLRELAIEGLQRLAEQCLQRKQYTNGLAITRKLLALDPWREIAHQQQMFFFAQTGQRSAALAQYDLCRRILADEFNIEPMTGTTAIYQQIRSGEIGEKDAATAPHPISPNSSSKLTHSALSPLLHSHQDWGEAVDVSTFYNREAELAILQQWVAQAYKRLILVVGMGGIGKTTLAIKLAQQLVENEELRMQNEEPNSQFSHPFTHVIWRSLRNAPSLETLLADLVPFLSNQQDSKADISRFIHWLRSHRCLVILDNVETLFQEGSHAGQYRSGYENYSELFEVIGEAQHQSCVLLTSREKLAEVAVLEGNPSVQVFLLTGSFTTAQALIETRGLFGSQMQKQQLAERYCCNPFALKIVAGLIQDLFEGNIEEFLKQEVILFNGIRRLLEQQFERLSALEQSIMYWLAINRERSTIEELAADIMPAVPRTQLLEAIESLIWRNLIERQQGYYTQQPIVMEYVIDRLVEKIVNEIVNLEIDLFNQCSLIKVNVKECLREAQKQLILVEISTRLWLTEAQKVTLKELGVVDQS